MSFDQYRYPFIPEIRFNIHIATAVRFKWVSNDILIQCIEITIAVTKVSRWYFLCNFTIYGHVDRDGKKVWEPRQISLQLGIIDDGIFIAKHKIKTTFLCCFEIDIVF